MSWWTDTSKWANKNPNCPHCCVHYNVIEERCAHGRLKHMLLATTCDDCKRITKVMQLPEDAQ